MNPRTRALLVATLLGGIVAGTIDIGAACLINGRDIPFILHSIAGGLFAKASFDGGARTALIGLLLQEGMGILIAAIYVSASCVIPALRQRWIRAGIAYGVVIFGVMNFVIVPLSAWHRFPHFTPLKVLEDGTAMLLFGLIIAYFTRRAWLGAPGQPRDEARHPPPGLPATGRDA